MKNQIRRRRRSGAERLTATEAARDFSKLLDRVESGAEAVIERHSRAVAVISPPSEVPRRFSECLAVPVPRKSARADDQFASDLEEIVTRNPVTEPPKWE